MDEVKPTEVKKETYSYRGWLISDSFIKRSFASVGYQAMGTIFIYLIFLAAALLLGGIALIIGAFLK